MTTKPHKLNRRIERRTKLATRSYDLPQIATRIQSDYDREAALRALARLQRHTR